MARFTSPIGPGGGSRRFSAAPPTDSRSYVRTGNPGGGGVTIPIATSIPPSSANPGGIPPSAWSDYQRAPTPAAPGVGSTIDRISGSYRPPRIPPPVTPYVPPELGQSRYVPVSQRIRAANPLPARPSVPTLADRLAGRVPPPPARTVTPYIPPALGETRFIPAIERLRATPAPSSAIARAIAEARPRIPPVRVTPGLFRAAGPDLASIAINALPRELIDPSYQRRESLIQRLSAPRTPRSEPFAPFIDSLYRDSIPAELRFLGPGSLLNPASALDPNNLQAQDLARIAASWLTRRLVDSLFGERPSVREQLGPTSPTPPRAPLLPNAIRYSFRISIIWYSAAYQHFNISDYVFEAWGPIGTIQWGDNIAGRPRGNSGVFIQSHGTNAAFGPTFPLGQRNTNSQIDLVRSATSDINQEGTFFYRAWPSGTPEPSTPLAPAPPTGGVITVATPVRPIAPILPPGIQTPEVPSSPTAPPAISSPGLPLIPAFMPATVPRISTTAPSTPSARAPSTPYFPAPPFNNPALQTPVRTTTITGTGGDPLVCRFNPDPYTAQIKANTDATNAKLDQIFNLLGDSVIMGKLNTIDGKLGPQLNGGISGVLKKFAQSSMVQSFLNTLTFITALHNALMLSNSVRQTLFSTFDIIYQLPGMSRFAPRDPETDEIVDYGSWASDQFDNLLRSAFGDQTVDTVRNSWNRASRIYQAGANILFSIQSIMWSVQEALEVVGNYVAKIGNALRKFGVVTERAYGWMNPQAADSKRFSRVFDAINNAAEATENIEQVAAATLDVTETAAQLNQQSQAFDRALRGVNEQGQPDPNLQIPFPYGDNREPQHVVAAEGQAAGVAQNLDQAIQPTDERRQEQ